MMITQVRKWKRMLESKQEDSNRYRKTTIKMSSSQKWKRRMMNLKAMVI